MSEAQQTRKIVDLIIRISLLSGLLIWCFFILKPFLFPFIWGVLIAVALHPTHVWLTARFGLNRKLVAGLLSALMILLILIPAYGFFSTITQWLIELKASFESGEIAIPELPQEIKNIPVVGEAITQFLENMHGDFTSLIQDYKDEILNLLKNFVGLLLDTGVNLFLVVVAIFISGFLLAFNGLEDWVDKLFNRIIGKEGYTYAELSARTIRSVVKGVLGVAVIQALLAGLGLSLSGIPHAPIWTLIALIFSIIQIGPSIVMAGAAIYLFLTQSLLFASLWTAYFVLVSLSDNIMKPFLLAKGAEVPMPVIFIGVVGGFLLSGFIGLFAGAIVLSIGYKLVIKWIEEHPHTPSTK
jgi:predicted PurR-regulated permease PerM